MKLPSKAKTQRVPYQQLRNWQIERASERVNERLRAVAAAAPSNINGEKKEAYTYINNGVHNCLCAVVACVDIPQVKDCAVHHLARTQRSTCERGGGGQLIIKSKQL